MSKRNIADIPVGTKVVFCGQKGTVISNTLKMLNTVALELDDGGVVKVNINSYDLKLEVSADLQQEFTDLYYNVRGQIQEKLDESNKAMAEAVKISEKYGVPFQNGTETYVPESMATKFPLLDIYDAGEFAGVDIWGDYAGWQSSTGSC